MGSIHLHDSVSGAVYRDELRAPLHEFLSNGHLLLCTDVSAHSIISVKIVDVSPSRVSIGKEIPSVKEGTPILRNWTSQMSMLWGGAGIHKRTCHCLRVYIEVG